MHFGAVGRRRVAEQLPIPGRFLVCEAEVPLLARGRCWDAAPARTQRAATTGEATGSSKSSDAASERSVSSSSGRDHTYAVLRH